MSNSQLKPIDVPVYSYWSALYHSFYSRQLYVDVGKRWKGLGLLYFVLVIAILCTPFALRVAFVFKQDFTQQIVEPLKQLPIFYVQNGVISIDQPTPYLIKNAKGQVVLIVDTEDKINQFDERYPDLVLLINKNSVAFRVPTLQLFHQSVPTRNTEQPLIQTLGKEVNTVFNGTQFIESAHIEAMIVAMQVLLYPLICVVFCSIFFVMFPVIALLGQVFANVFFSFQIGYKQACRLLIVSSTPMVFALLMFLFVDKVFMGMGIILVGLLIAYYCFALFSLRSESHQVVKS